MAIKVHAPNATGRNALFIILTKKSVSYFPSMSAAAIMSLHAGITILLVNILETTI